MVEWSFTKGWDAKEEGGGLLYFMDVDGYSPTQLEWSMKLWWPHCEALVAYSLLYRHTRDYRHLRRFLQVMDYTLGKFSDPEHGEWFGYLDRAGRVSQRFKGGPYKGCFHVPRCALPAPAALCSVRQTVRLGRRRVAEELEKGKEGERAGGREEHGTSKGSLSTSAPPARGVVGSWEPRPPSFITPPPPPQAIGTTPQETSVAGRPCPRRCSNGTKRAHDCRGVAAPCDSEHSRCGALFYVFHHLVALALHCGTPPQHLIPLLLHLVINPFSLSVLLHCTTCPFPRYTVLSTAHSCALHFITKASAKDPGSVLNAAPQIFEGLYRGRLAAKRSISTWLQTLYHRLQTQLLARLVTGTSWGWFGGFPPMEPVFLRWVVGGGGGGGYTQALPNMRFLCHGRDPWGGLASL